MRISRLILFFLVFALDIRVRASEGMALPESRSLLEEPAGCWAAAVIPCAVGTGPREKASLHFGDLVDVTLDRSTAVIRVSAREIRLIAGQVWIKAKSSFSVRTEFGLITAALGDFWIDRTSERVRVGVVHGVATLHPRGSDESLEVAIGLENWLGKVGLDGQARRGLPVPIVLKPHLARWSRLFSGSFAQFEEEARAFHKEWLAASGFASEVHKTLFDRKVASLRAEHARAVRSRRETDKRTRELIEMFRKKVLEP